MEHWEEAAPRGLEACVSLSLCQNQQLPASQTAPPWSPYGARLMERHPQASCAAGEGVSMGIGNSLGDKAPFIPQPHRVSFSVTRLMSRKPREEKCSE